MAELCGISVYELPAATQFLIDVGEIVHFSQDKVQSAWSI
jgi:hypothetical protein